MGKVDKKKIDLSDEIVEVIVEENNQDAASIPSLFFRKSDGIVIVLDFSQPD